jgi:hypothetical protein
MAQLITATEIVQLAFTNENVDTFALKDTFIEIAQEEHILPILGKDLYNEIVDQNNTATLTALNTTLLDDYIKNALAFYSKYELLDDLSIETTDKGLQVAESDFSRAANGEERGDMKSKAKKHADTFADKMTRFLNDSDDYPLYNQGNSQRNTGGSFGGVILSKTRNYCHDCNCQDVYCNC